ncbi:MAG: PilZ domain-containing protein [Polyangiales bacterium]
MLYLDLTLPQHELRAAISGDGGADAWIIVSARYDIPLGETVLVRVRCAGAQDGVFIEGIVQWRRSSPSRDLREGVGLRVMAHSLARWAFLRELSMQTAPSERRGAARLPLRMAVILVTAPRGSTRIYPCTMVDVSTGGACLTANHRLGPGEQGRCEWAVGARTFAVQFVVVWGGAGRLGIRLVESTEGAKAAWGELVESTRSALDARRTPARAPAPAASRDARSSGPIVEAEPRMRRGSLPDRAIVEVAGERVRRRDPRSG